MKQPDRFEYMPDKVGIKQEDDCHLHKAVLTLLRRQHNAYVRIVKRYQRAARVEPASSVGYRVALAQVLDAFARYKQGRTP